MSAPSSTPSATSPAPGRDAAPGVGPLAATRLPRRDLEAALRARHDARGEAERILAEAREAAEAIRAAAQAEAEARTRTLRRVADEELRRFVDAEALSRNAEALADVLRAAAEIRRGFEALTPWVVALVEASLRRILGALAPEDAAGRIVAAAVADLRLREGLALRVAPEDLTTLRAARAAHPERFEAVVAVVADAELPPGALVLDGAGGLVDVSLEAQLGRLRAHLEAELDAGDPP